MSGAGNDEIDLGAEYDAELFKPGVKSPIDQAIELLKDPRTMASLDTLVKESYKFIRLADDLHEIRSYLNDIRVCFIALTVSGYVGILLYALIMCLKRKRNNNGGENDDDGGRRFRGGNSPSRQRQGSRFENFDLEAGTGIMMTGGPPGDWDDANTVGIPHQPPPPNGTAIRTPDGYRYKPPNSAVRRGSGGGGGVAMGSTGHPFHQRLNALDIVDGGKSPPHVDTCNSFQNTGVMMSSTSSGSPIHQTNDGGFMEKVN